jgi:ABC-type phosphate transport system substrate-binding protein
MKWRSIPLVLCTALACSILPVSGGITALPAHAAAEVLVVVNDSVPAESSSRDTLQEIFLGRKTRWRDGQKIVPATLKEGQEHEEFLGAYVGKTPHQFRNYWKTKVFTGKGTAPAAFSSSEELVEFVKSTPGAIGYIPAGSYRNQLKSLVIE